MRLLPEQIELMTDAVVRRLGEAGAARFSAPDATRERLARALTEDLQVEDRLNDEVREILRGLSAQMEGQNIQFHEMFKLVKAKLVRERKLIL
jgi:hypothetical protein